MAIENRVRNLERRSCVMADGLRRCAACADGTRPTALVYRGAGVASPVPTPCPGCGRSNPLVFDIVSLARPQTMAS